MSYVTEVNDANFERVLKSSSRYWWTFGQSGAPLAA